MLAREPFILLDDARTEGASDARLYRAPLELVVARRPEEVAPALARIEELHRAGHEMAGYLAYEAGLALEPRLMPLAAARTGAAGPLVWFGAFAGYETIPAADMPQWLAAQASGPGAIGPVEPQLGFGGYEQAFAALQAAIQAGDIYQANLTFRLAAAWHGDPLALYAAIRPAAAAGYGGLVYDGAHWLLSFSPELFFALKDGAATVKPMKGTRPRGRAAPEDAALAAELAESVKDRAENLMIVDLMRNDLSRVAAPGSVRVENAFAVETYPTVHQMVSTVRARLQPDKGAVDMIRALFPCGSITGAPKIRAMELIDRVERDARGAYCGSIGRIDASGDSAFNVAIRTLRLTPGENGGRAVLGVGSAIVADSDGLGEWRECLVKGGFVRESAESFDLIETMAFTPDDGIPLLELHLERLKASAAELGFTFDRHAVRNAIQALCFEADQPSKLRLVVARSGSFSLELADLPPALPDPAPCALFRLPIDSGDWRLRHKSSDRGFYEIGLNAARKEGAAEALFLRSDGLVTEGCFTNVFVERDGKLLTPPLALGLLPGVLRRSLIEQGLAEEAELTLADLGPGFLIGNALRGLMPARLLP
ncbi:aminodeoxychorismate synthase component I [Novosphingobium sp. JCM 18896]|uniref:aminodeoxychorismate synthase component I n=1 Tax=Novosphingobium sp. JCM 18896 TaxID=2989731 RepID=UPI002222BA78|nr:aminodeoxychorismate synthase component I [Novosphingobium sp. JCM 18896]MCW1429191.1 aminodeoxychorismate synthase component I [Novosphingobium sp. JCM 18896]